MVAKYDFGQAKELSDIDDSSKNVGIHVARLIQRLTAGGARRTGSRRHDCAKGLWDMRFGEMIYCRKFSDYLFQVPYEPSTPIEGNYSDDGTLVHVIRLQDGSPDIRRMCQLLDVTYDIDPSIPIVSSAEEMDPSASIYWMHINVHRDRTGLNISVACNGFDHHEHGMSAAELLSLLANWPTLLCDRNLIAARSICDDCPLLLWWRNGGPVLSRHTTDECNNITSVPSRYQCVGV